MEKRKPITARESAFEWVQHAHKLYITARFLFMNGFHFNGVLIGSHALEIYLKAYLIYKTGTYEKGHDLPYYYRQCMQYDSFFEDDSLSKYFLPEKTPPVLGPELWGIYTDALRYPKPIPRRAKQGFSVGSGSDTAGTFESLDCIAHFMYKTISPDPKVKIAVFHLVTGETEQVEGNVIDDFLSGKGYYHSLGTQENASEIKELFLRHNRYFDLSEEQPRA